ncbi:MAG: hypothetical protein AAGD25_20385 [Cyanobacteria bacterium P01_F01_bin.150]
MQADVENDEFLAYGPWGAWTYSNDLWISKPVKHNLHVTITGAESYGKGAGWEFSRFHVTDNDDKARGWYYEGSENHWVRKDGGSIPDEVALKFLKDFGLGKLYYKGHEVK